MTREKRYSGENNGTILAQYGEAGMTFVGQKPKNEERTICRERSWAFVGVGGRGAV